MSRDGETDEDLVRLAKSGDEAATRVLFDRHVKALRARVRRGLPGEMRSKVSESDVMQDAFIAAFLKLGDFEDRGDGSFARWLHVVLERKLVDEVRRHVGAEKRDARRELAAGSSVVRIAGASPDPSPSVVAADAEEWESVREAMRLLPESMSTVLRLIHEERLTIEAAAARMGRTLAATKKLYGRAAMRLARQMREARGTPA